MIPLGGKLAHFWKHNRRGLAHAFQDLIVSDKPPSPDATKERYRG